MIIERIGKTGGRWAKYRLFIDEVDVGMVKRTLSRGSDRLAGDTHYDAWWAGRTEGVGGMTHETQAAAEHWLVKRQTTVINPRLPEPVAKDAMRILDGTHPIDKRD